MKLKFVNKPIQLRFYAAVLSLLNLVFFHFPFFRFVWQNISSEGWNKYLVILSLVILVFVANYFVFYMFVFLLRKAGKAILSLSFFLSAVCVYYIKTYNVIIDDTMLGNFFNTNFEEASGFVTVQFVLFVVVFGLAPAIYALWRKVDYGNWKKFGINSGPSVLLMALLIVVNSGNILWIGKYDTELGGLVMPWSYSVNTVRYFNQIREANKEEILLGDGVFSDDEKSVMVLVIGESARKANFSLYGYERDTNPLLSKRGDLHVLEANSCATYTTAGVKSILEYEQSSDLYEILPNYLYRSGSDVQWRTTNWGEPPVHIEKYYDENDLRDQYPEVKDSDYDDVLICGLKELIDSCDNSKLLIVLHTSTSHGPMYTKKYPPEFEIFTPVCDQVEDSGGSIGELVNAYDNSVVYTDYLLEEIIEVLDSIEDRHCAMMFVSDHGESLGENNLYMHGVPMKMAPKEQYEIPYIVWLSDDYRKVKDDLGLIDQHTVFHSVLDFLSLESPVYNPDKDIFEK